MPGRPVSSAYPYVWVAILLAFTLLGNGLFNILGSDSDGESSSPAADPPRTSPLIPPPHHPSKTNRPEFPNAGAYVRHELKSINIPKVDFEEATLEEALDFLRQRSRELSDQPPERAGFGFVVRKAHTESGVGAGIDSELDAEAGLGASSPTRQTVTLQAENASLYDLLQHICRKAELQLEIEPSGLIVIKPAAAAPDPASPDRIAPNDPFSGSVRPSTPDPFAP